MIRRASVIFILLLVGVAACKKKDSNPPTITLAGDKYIHVSLNSSWQEPGYSAEDDQNGDITEYVEVEGSVNSNYAGSYVLTYTVADGAGNETTATRVIEVYNEAQYLSGHYAAQDTCSSSPAISYMATIMLSNTVNKEFFIENFGGWNTKCTCLSVIKMNASGAVPGSTLSWAQQSIAGNDSLSAATGSGTIVSLSPVQFSLTYQWTNGSSTQTCTSLFTQQ